MVGRRRLVFEVAAVVTGGAALMVAAYAFFARGCGPQSLLCGSQIQSEHLSPNRQMKVVVFLWDCGATTGTALEASVLQADRHLPDGVGNVFATDDNWGEDRFDLGSGPRGSVD